MSCGGSLRIFRVPLELLVTPAPPGMPQAGVSSVMPSGASPCCTPPVGPPPPWSNGLQGSFRTAAGQLMDTTTPLNGTDSPLSVYTLQSYMAIAAHKTAYFSFYLPLACSMLLAGETDEAAFAEAERIMVEMGQLYQVGRGRGPPQSKPWVSLGHG